MKKRFSAEGNGVDKNHWDAMRKVSSSMPLPGALYAYLSSQRTSLKLRFPVGTEGRHHTARAMTTPVFAFHVIEGPKKVTTPMVRLPRKHSLRPR